MENGRRSFHCGKTPRGIKSPHVVHGRYSKALPQNLLELDSAAKRDPELNSLRDGIALIDSRIIEVLESMSNCDSEYWSVQTLGGLLFRVELSNAAKDYADARLTFEDLSRRIEIGAALEAKWDELQQLLHEQCKLISQEHRQLMATNQMLNEIQATTLFESIKVLIFNHVTDPSERKAIAIGLRAYRPR